MKTLAQTLNDAERRRRLRMAIRLQEIEGNPLTAEEIAMFEMFHREGWTGDQCRAYILEKAGLSSNAAAE